MLGRFLQVSRSMGQIENTILVYERLSKQKYKITIENGVEFVLTFDKSRYHHLVGYQHLTDMTSIADPPYGKDRFYRQLRNHKIKESNITKSALFKHIAERVEFFGYIEDIVSESNCKIIIEFDKNKAHSDIEAKYYLYKRSGNPLNMEPVTYYSLFIGYDETHSSYYPATYIVEHSNRYINGQNMLDCKIELIL